MFLALHVLAEFQTRLTQKIDVNTSSSLPTTTQSISFHVQKSQSYSSINTPIPFEVERHNMGQGMNLQKGIFTVSQPGAYFFSFSGISGGNMGAEVGLYLNGNEIGRGHGVAGHNTFTLQSTVNLKMGDKVWVQVSKTNMQLFDDNRHFTQFTGWLL